MKSVILSLILASAISPAISQEKSVGYNIGLCQPGFFMAAHVEVSKDELDVTHINTRPGEVLSLDIPTVFKHVESKDGLERYVDEADQLEFDLRFSNGQVDGQGLDLTEETKPVHVFGSQGAVNGLAEDGSKLHEQCLREISK